MAGIGAACLWALSGVAPAKAGAKKPLKRRDSRFRGNDGASRFVGRVHLKSPALALSGGTTTPHGNGSPDETPVRCRKAQRREYGELVPLSHVINWITTETNAGAAFMQY